MKPVTAMDTLVHTFDMGILSPGQAVSFGTVGYSSTPLKNWASSRQTLLLVDAEKETIYLYVVPLAEAFVGNNIGCASLFGFVAQDGIYIKCDERGCVFGMASTPFTTNAFGETLACRNEFFDNVRLNHLQRASSLPAEHERYVAAMQSVPIQRFPASASRACDAQRVVGESPCCLVVGNIPEAHIESVFSILRGTEASRFLATFGTNCVRYQGLRFSEQPSSSPGVPSEFSIPSVLCGSYMASNSPTLLGALHSSASSIETFLSAPRAVVILPPNGKFIAVKNRKDKVRGLFLIPVEHSSRDLPNSPKDVLETFKDVKLSMFIEMSAPGSDLWLVVIDKDTRQTAGFVYMTGNNIFCSDEPANPIEVGTLCDPSFGETMLQWFHQGPSLFPVGVPVTDKTIYTDTDTGVGINSSDLADACIASLPSHHPGVAVLCTHGAPEDVKRLADAATKMLVEEVPRPARVRADEIPAGLGTMERAKWVSAKIKAMREAESAKNALSRQGREQLTALLGRLFSWALCAGLGIGFMVTEQKKEMTRRDVKKAAIQKAVSEFTMGGFQEALMDDKMGAGSVHYMNLDRQVLEQGSILTSDFALALDPPSDPPTDGLTLGCLMEATNATDEGSAGMLLPRFGNIPSACVAVPVICFDLKDKSLFGLPYQEESTGEFHGIRYAYHHMIRQHELGSGLPGNNYRHYTQLTIELYHRFLQHLVSMRGSSSVDSDDQLAKDMRFVIYMLFCCCASGATPVSFLYKLATPGGFGSTEKMDARELNMAVTILDALPKAGVDPSPFCAVFQDYITRMADCLLMPFIRKSHNTVRSNIHEKKNQERVRDMFCGIGSFRRANPKEIRKGSHCDTSNVVHVMALHLYTPEDNISSNRSFESCLNAARHILFKSYVQRIMGEQGILDRVPVQFKKLHQAVYLLQNSGGLSMDSHSRVLTEDQINALRVVCEERGIVLPESFANTGEVSKVIARKEDKEFLDSIFERGLESVLPPMYGAVLSSENLVEGDSLPAYITALIRSGANPVSCAWEHEAEAVLGLDTNQLGRLMDAVGWTDHALVAGTLLRILWKFRTRDRNEARAIAMTEVRDALERASRLMLSGPVPVEPGSEACVVAAAAEPNIEPDVEYPDHLVPENDDGLETEGQPIDRPNVIESDWL